MENITFKTGVGETAQYDAKHIFWILDYLTKEDQTYPDPSYKQECVIVNLRLIRYLPEGLSMDSEKLQKLLNTFLDNDWIDYQGFNNLVNHSPDKRNQDLFSPFYQHFDSTQKRDNLTLLILPDSECCYGVDNNLEVFVKHSGTNVFVLLNIWARISLTQQEDIQMGLWISLWNTRKSIKNKPMCRFNTRDVNILIGELYTFIGQVGGTSFFYKDLIKYIYQSLLEKYIFNIFLLMRVLYSLSQLLYSVIDIIKEISTTSKLYFNVDPDSEVVIHSIPQIFAKQTFSMEK